MNLRDDVKRLEEELKRKKEAVYFNESHCTHVWSGVIYDPTTEMKYSYAGLEAHGSDVHPIYNTYSSEVPRWSRSCEVCGKVEYTKTEKAVKYEPDFN